MTVRDLTLRSRLIQLELAIKDERQQEITRAIEYKNRGNDRMASYHTGLADGRNSLLATLRKLNRENDDREPIGVDA